jgi:glycosyltransferase involved in cell wall biosynthesis
MICLDKGNGQLDRGMNQVTVVIPTLNGEKRLVRCLESIRNQDFPADMIKIIVVDDDSTDNTRGTCESFNVDLILVSGRRDIEFSKALGLKQCRTEFILLMDDDNALPSRKWLSAGIEKLKSDPSSGGYTSARYWHHKDDTLANRYASLFGTNDPVVYYLGQSDKLKATQNLDFFQRKVDVYKVLDSDHVQVKLREEKILTFGSNGFLTRKSLVDNFEGGTRFFHIDYVRFISQSSTPNLILSAKPIVHDHAKSLRIFVDKCKRNGKIYLLDKSQDVVVRKFDYNLSPLKYCLLILKIFTLVVPLTEAVLGFARFRDWAWFLHPIMSIWVFLIYANLKVRHVWKGFKNALSMKFFSKSG